MRHKLQCRAAAVRRYPLRSGRRDGTTVGGHLLYGEVWPTLEVVITEVGGSLIKRVDPETGLALLTGTAEPSP